jgi:hypothetical protein
MAKFDQDYFDKICKWVRTAENGEYNAYKWASDVEKFIGHLKWYGLKNKDARIVEVEQATETEIMYGINYCNFFLYDLAYPGVMSIGHLPEEIRMQKMNRIMNNRGGFILTITKDQGAMSVREKLSEAKFSINDKVVMEKQIKGFSETRFKNYYMVVMDVIKSETARNNRYKCAFVERGKELNIKTLQSYDIRWFFEFNLISYSL